MLLDLGFPLLRCVLTEDKLFFWFAFIKSMDLSFSGIIGKLKKKVKPVLRLVKLSLNYRKNLNLDSNTIFD